MANEQQMSMNLGLHQDQLMRTEMQLSELMRRRSELWESTKKLDSVSGYLGSKNAWIEDQQALIRRYIGVKSGLRVRRKIGGLLPYLLIGEPGSGKTTLGKQTLYKTLYQDTEEDLLAPMACYEHAGEAEIPIHQWTFEWGDACSLIEDPVPDDVDYLNSDYWRQRKIREILIASELFGTGLELMAERADNRALDILLIDAPGGTGIDRATPQLKQFVNKEGRFDRLQNRYIFPQVIGVKASAHVLEHGRSVRAGMYDFETPKEKLDYLAANGVVIDADEADPAEAIERYANGSANPLQVAMIHKEVEEYQARRMAALCKPGAEPFIPDTLDFYRRYPSCRQHDLAHFYLPDYFANLLAMQFPQNSMIVSNEVVLPTVSFPADVGSHHPFEEIPGFIEEMKKRAYKQLRLRSSKFRKMGFSL